MSMRRLLLLSLVAAAGCAQTPTATGCRADSQCAAASRCTSGVCIADARPTASLRAVGAVQEYELATLDGSASADPDGDLAGHRWSVRAVDAPCAAPEVADRTAVAHVRFGCAGSFEVTLVVHDSLGVESDPVHAAVTVSPSAGAPLVTTGPDVATDHACAGTPLACRTTEQVQLVAAASAPAGTTLRWTVVPPAGRPLDATRRVRFVPDAYAAAPRVEIVTDGTAIAGDWIFRAEVVDAYGVVGAAHTRVSVRNRPPVFTVLAPAPFEHAFDRAASAFRSAGAVAWSVVDPDGDPLEVSGVWRHVGDGEGSLFDGDFDGTSVRFSVAVPYAVREDALRLRGGAGLVREIELRALDVNREAGRAVIPIEIGNRPPVPAGGTFDAAVPHRFDPARSRYVATLRAGTFVDPDGDPLVDSTGPGLCDTIRPRGNDVTVECSAPFEGVPAAERLVGPRTFAVAPHDPWEAAAAAPVVTVDIQNSQPVLRSPPPVPWSVCAYPWVMMVHRVEPVTFDVAVDVSDPDGDPVVVGGRTIQGGSFSPAGMVLTAPGTVPLHFVQPTYPWLPGSSSTASWVTATDGNWPAELGVSPIPFRC